MRSSTAITAASIGGLVIACALLPGGAESQIGYIAGLRLQNSTPGTADPGNGHISGTFIAGILSAPFAAIGGGAVSRQLDVRGAGAIDSVFPAVAEFSALSSGMSAVMARTDVIGTVAVGGAAHAGAGTVGAAGYAFVPDSVGLYGAVRDTGTVGLFCDGFANFGANAMFGGAPYTASPVFPIDFTEALGNKISLWGTNPVSHFGMGIQAATLQLFSAGAGDIIAFGYGGSAAFTERARFYGDNDLRLGAGGVDSFANIDTPYDIVFSKDFDNDNGSAWHSFVTNGGSIEQVRIVDSDEAPAFFDGAVTANGIDYAEAFKVLDQNVEAGDVVTTYNNNWEYINKSGQAYDSNVIGVVSTKPAFVAGMSFNAEDAIDPELTKRRDAARAKKDEKLAKELTIQMGELVKRAYRPVAFMGRVPVKVTGVVKAGQHLTTSNVAGRAMAMDRAGHSLGIALEDSNGGSDKIMVLIQPKYWAGLATVPDPFSSELKALRAQNEKLKRNFEETTWALRQKNDQLEARLQQLENKSNSNR